jgi:hypothetical protein
MDRGQLKRPAPARNPLYLLLLLAGAVFVVTALAYALVPELERKAIEAGNPSPPSALRDALRADGWKWLLAEVAVVVALSVLSMVWDHRRTLREERGVGGAVDEHRGGPAP